MTSGTSLEFLGLDFFSSEAFPFQNCPDNQQNTTRCLRVGVQIGQSGRSNSYLEQPNGFEIASNNTNLNEVPEPLTILGTATALGFGALLKRKNTSNKDTE